MRLLESQKNIVSLVEMYEIKDFVSSHIEDDEKKNYIIEKAKAIFDNDKMDFLNTYEEQFHSDTSTSCFKYYKNGYVEITGDDISQVHPYDKLPKPIWGRQIIQRDFKLIEELENIDKCEFNTFLINVTNGKEDRYKSLVSAIGYLNHNYHNPALRKAVLLIDEELQDDVKEANGGTGKSICGKALLYSVINSDWIDSGNLKGIRAFTFQSVRPDTALIIIDDLNSDFDFSTMFSIVTEGLTVEKKYQPPFIIKNVKFLITTNFTIGGRGSSFDRRLSEHEFCKHYNLSHRPEHDFGHRLFEDWNETEWLLFDNLMLRYIQFYLKEGKILSYEKEALEIKKLIKRTFQEFYDFAKELKVNHPYVMSDLLFLYNNEYASTQIKPNTLTKWLKNEYAPIVNCYLSERRTSSGKVKIVTLIPLLKGERRLKS